MTIDDILVWEATNGAPADTRGDCISDVDAVGTTAAHVHRTGLALSDRPSIEESSLASPLDQVRGALVRRGSHRLC
jgi:hypothetical protein